MDLETNAVKASGGNNRTICGLEDGQWLAFMIVAVGGKMKRESGNCVLRLGERASVSRRVTREPCDRDETGRLGGSARGQRARPVAYPLKPVTLDGW